MFGSMLRADKDPAGDINSRADVQEKMQGASTNSRTVVLQKRLHGVSINSRTVVLQEKPHGVSNTSRAVLQEMVHGVSNISRAEMQEKMHGVRTAELSSKAEEAAEASASHESNGAALVAVRGAVEPDRAASEPQDTAAEPAASRPGPSDQEEEPPLVAKASVTPDDAAADTEQCVPSESQTDSLLKIDLNESNKTICCKEVQKELHRSCDQRVTSARL